MNLRKSVEQLENDIWKEPKEFPSGLVERCYGYRKIPIGLLTTEQLRTLTLQNIGIKYLLPIVIEILERNPLVEGDLYKGDLLGSTRNIEDSIWESNSELALRYANLIEKNELLISAELGEKRLNTLKQKRDTKW